MSRREAWWCFKFGSLVWSLVCCSASFEVRRPWSYGRHLTVEPEKIAADSEVSGIRFSDEQAVFTILASRYGLFSRLPSTMSALLMKWQLLAEPV